MSSSPLKLEAEQFAATREAYLRLPELLKQKFFKLLNEKCTDVLESWVRLLNLESGGLRTKKIVQRQTLEIQNKMDREFVNPAQKKSFFTLLNNFFLAAYLDLYHHYLDHLDTISLEDQSQTQERSVIQQKALEKLRQESAKDAFFDLFFHFIQWRKTLRMEGEEIPVYSLFRQLILLEKSLQDDLDKLIGIQTIHSDMFQKNFQKALTLRAQLQQELSRLSQHYRWPSFPWSNAEEVWKTVQEVLNIFLFERESQFEPFYQLIVLLQEAEIHHRSVSKRESLTLLKNKACDELRTFFEHPEPQSILGGPPDPFEWLKWVFQLRNEALEKQQKVLETHLPSLSQFISICDWSYLQFNETQEGPPEKKTESSSSTNNSSPKAPIPLTEKPPEAPLKQEPEKTTPSVLPEPESTPSVLAISAIPATPTILVTPDTLALSSTATKRFTLQDSSRTIAQILLQDESLLNAPEFLQECIWRLLVEKKYGFALQMTLELEQKYSTFPICFPSWLLSTLMASQRIHYSAGVLAQRLQENFSRFEVSLLETKDKEWNQALRLLLAAATLRPALIAPHSGAHLILKQMQHVGGNFPRFYALLETIVAYGIHQIPLDFRALHKTRSLESWENDLKRLKERAQIEWDQAKLSNYRGDQAIRFWKVWGSPGELLEGLLRPVRENNTEKISQVQGILKRLSSESLIENEVKLFCREKINYSQWFLEKDWQKILRRTQTALDIAREWLQIQDQLIQKSDFLEKEAEKIKRELGNNYKLIQQELHQNLHASSFLVKMACEICWDSFEQLRILFTDENYLFVPEISPPLLFSADLLQLTSISLGEEWQPLEDISVSREILKFLAENEMNWCSAFQKQLEKGDLLASNRILEFLSHTTLSVTTEVQPSERELQEARSSWKSLLERRILDVRKLLSDPSILDLIAPSEAEHWNAVLFHLEQNIERTMQFHLLLQEIEKIETALHSKRVDRLKEVHQQLQSSSLSPEQTKRIDDLLARGDIHTANDYLERIQRGEPLPESMETQFVFLDFFKKDPNPLHAGAYFSIVEGMEGAAPVKAPQIIKAFENRERLFNLDLKRISGSQGKKASKILETWFETKRLAKIGEEKAKILFNALGFNTLELQVHQSGEQTWLHVKTDPIRDRALCPIDTFGSEADGHYKVLCVWDLLTEDDLVLSSNALSQEPYLVFYFGRLTEKRRKNLARLARHHHKKIAILDEILLIYLCSIRGAKLPVFFQCALPFSYLEPYSTTAGLVSPEMFYGRTREIESLKKTSGSCFVYGGRQLGKTAILRFVERTFHAPNEGRLACWIELKEKGIGAFKSIDDLWILLAEELKNWQVLNEKVPLHIKPDTLMKYIRAWLQADPKRRILFLLDEADDFLNSDGKENFKRCSQLKGLMDETNRRFKIVFAGLHNVQRTTKVSNNPLAHYGEALCIGPLLSAEESQSARELVELPFACLGYFFESPDLVVRILAQTNYYPSLIQLYCLHLLRHLMQNHQSLFDTNAGPPFSITRAHIENAYKNQSLRNEIRQRFVWTLDLDKRYRLIAFILAFYHEDLKVKGMSIERIRQETKTFWPEGFKHTASEYDYKGLLEEMMGLGILRRIPHSEEYTLRNPNVVTLLGSAKEISDELESCHSWEAPIEYEPKHFRRILHSEQSILSPLTAFQENELKVQGYQVSLICGCEASGLFEVPEALRSFFGSGFFASPDTLSDLDSFRVYLERLGNREAQGTNLILIPWTCLWGIDWLRYALEKIKKLKSRHSFLNITFFAFPEKIWTLLEELKSLESQGLHTFSLQPWEDVTLRRWLEESWINGPKDLEQRKKLQKKTSNWPYLIQKFYQQAKQAPVWEKELDSMYGDSFLAIPETLKEMQRIFGLILTEPASTLKILADYGEPLLPSEMDELLKEKCTPDLIQKTLEWAKRLNLIVFTPLGWKLDAFVSQILSKSSYD